MDESSKNKQQSAGQGAISSESPPDGGYMLALRVIKALEEGGFQARLAGGCVRDRQLGIKPKDYDIATTALPEQICLIFKQKSIKVVPTGIDHGTVTVVIAGTGIEVTTLRRDVSTDGRRATVAFANDFEEDAERRDFTFNAMYEDKDGHVYDFFGGLDDLKQGRLRFVGDAQQRIQEDYLRILRMFRFWARFGFAPEPATLQACQREASGLKIVSQERITHELMATLEGDAALPAVRSLQETGILTQLLKIQARDESWPQLDALNISRKAERSAARLALLIKADLVQSKNHRRSSVEQQLQELRLSRQLQQKILLHVFAEPEKLEDSPAILMEAIDSWEQQGGSFLDTILPIWKILRPEHPSRLLELEKVEAQYGHRRRARLPLDGQHLIASLHIPAGPQLGELLLELKRSWRLGVWQTADEGMEWARVWWQGHKSGE